MSGLLVYKDLSTDLEERLRSQATRIRQRINAQTQAMLETGRDLAAVRDEIEHGIFEQWVESECGITSRLARMYIRAAEWTDNECEYRKLVSDLEPTVVIEFVPDQRF